MYYFLESVDLDFEHPEDFLVQQDFLSEVLSLEQQADFSFPLLHLVLLFEQAAFSSLEHFVLDLEQQDFSDFEHFVLDLEQDFFFSPLQQVPFALFLQVASHIFPVLLQIFSVLLSTLSSVVTFSSVVVCAFILVIPMNRNDNNTIDSFFIL
ncbi:MAG: hypothetical protein HOE25_02675 [Flavobacteriales bacterium]|nr:hypothetical protein [Flavobacteriales bacterium]